MMYRRSQEIDRVRRYSTQAQLQNIDRKLERSLRLYASQPRDVIDDRIRELRKEWSIERILQVNAAAIGLTTALLAVTRDSRWGYVTCAGLGFFLWHAIDGFDPPLPFLRSIGVRTRAEINREIYGLKAIRGDFDYVSPLDEADARSGVAAALHASGV